MIIQPNHSEMLSIAPMLDWTDRHFRYFFRLISQKVTLYTEMIHVNAIRFGDTDHHLKDKTKGPLTLQLGGSDPLNLSECCKIVADYPNYTSINLNVGCPSERVQNGNFGLCLMQSPKLVAQCVEAMQKSTRLPISVKCRTGVDEEDSFEFLTHFIQTLADVGIQHVSVHARKGWLKGLSPKENRDIPPLQYERVYKLKQTFPNLNIGINGGILNLQQAQTHLQHVDQVMIGRAAYHEPFSFSKIDSTLYGMHNDPSQSPKEIVYKMFPYIEEELKAGTKLSHITRHMLNLFHGMPNARKWRQYLSQKSPTSQNPNLLEEALIVAQYV